MKLHDLASSQIPDQSRGPEVLVRICITATEEPFSIPAKAGCELGPWTGNESPTVLHEEAPSMEGNAHRTRSLLEDVDATDPFVRGAVGTPTRTLRMARGRLRGAIRGVDVIDVRREGNGSGDLRGGRGWQTPKPNRTPAETNPVRSNAQRRLGRFKELCIADRLAFDQKAHGACLLLKRDDGLFAAGDGFRQKAFYLRGPQVARGRPLRAILVHSSE
jgi:hypothetical protein